MTCLILFQIITKYEVVDQIQKFENFFEFNVAKAARTSFDKEEWLDTPWKRFFEVNDAHRYYELRTNENNSSRPKYNDAIVSKTVVRSLTNN